MGRVSDHSGVVLTLDWAETDKGQGVFRCGAETHKNKNYQGLMHCSFYKSIIDYIDNTELQNDLRVRINKILKLTVTRNKITNDLEMDPAMKEETLFVLEDSIKTLTRDLPEGQLKGLKFLPILTQSCKIRFLPSKRWKMRRQHYSQISGPSYSSASAVPLF